MILKKYKAGQLITINNCVYRIKKTLRKHPCSNDCFAENLHFYLTKGYDIKHKAVCYFCIKYLPTNYYLAPIKCLR